MRPRILFLTVMPSPYQRELFSALEADERLAVHVLYYTNAAADRDWDIGPLSSWEAVMAGRTLNWLGPSAHLNQGVTALLKKESYDLVVLSDYSAVTTQIAMRVLSQHKKRWVFWGEVPGVRQRGLLGLAVRRQLQRPIAQASAIAAIGSEAADTYQRLFPKICVFNIPYFCDLKPFETAALGRASRTKKTVDVLFSGQLIKRKGVDLLVSAFLKIADQVPSLRLQLLGGGPSSQVLENMIPAKFKDRVQFLGFRQPSDIPSVFADADIFVLPSRHDGWGVVVNEALGAGLPIIVSDRVGARDLVQNELNGFVSAAGDSDALANVLLKLAQSEDMRRSFGKASAMRARKWGLQEGVERWVELLRQVRSAEG